jgi:hypothetical protein
MQNIVLDENARFSALLDSDPEFPVILLPFYEDHDSVPLTEAQAMRLYEVLKQRYEVKSCQE